MILDQKNEWNAYCSHRSSRFGRGRILCDHKNDTLSSHTHKAYGQASVVHQLSCAGTHACLYAQLPVVSSIRQTCSKVPAKKIKTRHVQPKKPKHGNKPYVNAHIVMRKQYLGASAKIRMQKYNRRTFAASKKNRST